MRAREGTYAAIKTAVHAYARNPTDANAKVVRAAMFRKRLLDDRLVRRSNSPVDRAIPVSRVKQG